MSKYTPFKFARALCRKPAQSMARLGIRLAPTKDKLSLDYNLCLQQHSKYVQAIQSSGVDVTVLEPEEDNPDCVFVEDTAVIIGKTVLITNPGAKSRSTEVNAIMRHFQDKEPAMRMVRMQAPAFADGGDVMFTGSEIFVGLSRRTNRDGVEFIRRTFPEFPVHSVGVGEGTLHLKSMLGVPKPGWLAVGSSRNADNALKDIIDKGVRKYSVLRVVGDFSASCIFCNGVLIHRCAEEYPDSYRAYQDLTLEKKTPLNFSELEKVDGSLTCCSLLY